MGIIMAKKLTWKKSIQRINCNSENSRIGQCNGLKAIVRAISRRALPTYNQ